MTTVNLHNPANLPIVIATARRICRSYELLTGKKPNVSHIVCAETFNGLGDPHEAFAIFLYEFNPSFTEAVLIGESRTPKFINLPTAFYNTYLQRFCKSGNGTPYLLEEHDPYFLGMS